MISEKDKKKRGEGGWFLKGEGGGYNNWLNGCK